MNNILRNKRKLAGVILAGIEFIMSILFIIFALSTKVVPVKYLLIAGILLGILPVFVVLMQLNKISGIVGIVLSALVCIALGYGIYLVRHADKALDKVMGGKTEITVVNVYVKADDPVTSINEAIDQGYEFGVLKEGDRDKVNGAIADIEASVGSTLKIKEYDSIFAIAKAIEANELKTFIATSAFVSVLDGSEEYYGYSSKLRILMEKEVETVIETPEDEKKTEIPKTAGCFVAYISGIDTFGSVNIKARSDVNILAVVNRNTRQVLLLSTPRDYWVPLTVSGGSRDKLTHAGIYGIECSMGTLEMLYSVGIDYYVRMNFSGFEKIIDSLGGVDVESQYSFSTVMGPKTFNYEKGINHLAGDAALAFARERYSFADGDFQRGRNQMAVIKAVISSLESSKILNNFTGLMESLSESFQTNMTKDELGELVQEQLDTDKSWTVLSYSAKGTAAMRPTYSSGGEERSVVLQNDESIAYGTELIRKVLAGEEMTQEQLNENAP